MKNYLMRFSSALQGVVLVIIGIVVIVNSKIIMGALPVILGLVLFCFGAWECYVGITTGKKMANGMPLLLRGIIGVLVGLILLFNQSVSTAFLGIVLGIWALLTGLVSLKIALTMYKTIGILAFLDSALRIIIGLIMVFAPLVGIIKAIQVIGVFCLITGIANIISCIIHKQG